MLISIYTCTYIGESLESRVLRSDNAPFRHVASRKVFSIGMFWRMAVKPGRVSTTDS